MLHNLNSGAVGYATAQFRMWYGERKGGRGAWLLGWSLGLSWGVLILVANVCSITDLSLV